MDRSEFRATLAELGDDDREGLVAAIQQRVRTLSSRHLTIQDRIDDSESTRRDLEGRLEDAEAEIITQADASVETDVTSIEDIEALPKDVAVEFDPALLAEVQDIREQARSNYERTAAEGADLQTELSTNNDELQRLQSVLADLEDETVTVAAARDRLLSFLEDAPEEVDLEAAGGDGEQAPTGDGGADDE